MRIIEFAVEKEATNLVNKKYSTTLIEAQESYYIPIFNPVDEFDFTFMGRVLRHILQTIEKGFYLDHLSSWYDAQGNQLFGLRHVCFVQDYLGTHFLVGLDRLITYNIVNRINQFFRDYGLHIGGGGISESKRATAKVFNKDFHKNLKELDDDLSNNIGNLNPGFQKRYKVLTSQMTNFYNTCSQVILQIGQL